MDRTTLESRAFRTQVKAYLESQGWTGESQLRYEEGFQTDATITVPMVAIHFLPSNSKALQLGNIDDKTFRRFIQVDCYMESEDRAGRIMDDVMDFMDLIPIAIVDLMTTDNVGSLICYDTDTISGEILSPNLNVPKVNRWRSIIRGTFEAFYPGS
jgi:hypothetical protein